MNERQSVTELRVRKRRLVSEITEALQGFEQETVLSLGRDLEVTISQCEHPSFMAHIAVDVKVIL